MADKKSGNSRPYSCTTHREKKAKRIKENNQFSLFNLLSSFEEFTSIFKTESERANFIKATFNKSTYELSDDYGVSPMEIRKWKQDCKDRGLLVGEGGFPESLAKDCDDFLIVKDNPVLIMGDAEIPEHDVEMFGMVMDIGKKFNVKTLIINGDFLAMDSFSKHNKTSVSPVAFAQELAPALISLKVFLKQFKQIIYITGNHEKRLPHAVQGHITVQLFFMDLEGVTYSEYDHCLLESAGEIFYVCHPSNYSKLPCRVPSHLASIEYSHSFYRH